MSGYVLSFVGLCQHVRVKSAGWAMVLLVVLGLAAVLPIVRCEEVGTYELVDKAWTINYRVSDVRVNPGQVVTLDVNFTANVLIYDMRLDAVSNPVQLVADHAWGFSELGAGLLQRHTFQVKIPDDAAVGTKYGLDLVVRGYNDPPWFDFLGWRPRGFLWWTESPEYTGDTRGHPDSSIVVTVI